MHRISTGLACALLVAALPLASHAEASKPIKLSRAQLAGKIFEDHVPVTKRQESERGPFTTRDVEIFRSADRHFDAGVYRAGPNRFTIDEPYGVDEFMYFLEGGVRLTSSDGSVTTVGEGEAVLVPKGWTGLWDTEGYTKIYVIFSPDKPIE
jgi:uncharacterized cupin superfamily protein